MSSHHLQNSPTNVQSVDDGVPEFNLARSRSQFPDSPATPDPSHPTPVLSKDVPINQSSNTWARIFLPRQALDNSSKKLPLVIYIHGGGFIFLSAASTLNHEFCSMLALELPAIFVSVDYRLAPEHRLPAAYDDSVEAIHWVKTSDEVWLRQHADYDNCFVMGSSAGGNIAYHAGLRVAEAAQNLEPLKIRGLILHQPFFGGTQMTESEKRLIDDPNLPPHFTDIMWGLSLPIGAGRDHEYCDPTVGGGSRLIEGLKLLGWRVLVTGCDGDPLIDRQVGAADLMEGKGVKVARHFVEGGGHGADVAEPSRRRSLLLALQNFVTGTIVVG